MGAVRHVDVPADVYEAINVTAETMDLPTSAVAAAVLRGAVALGQVHRLADRGFAGTTPRRRPRPKFWEQTSPDTLRTVAGVASPPGVWAHGPFTLTRITTGAPNVSTPRPGEGWFLEGPHGDPTLCGWARDDAMAAAEEIVRGYERTAQAAS